MNIDDPSSSPEKPSFSESLANLEFPGWSSVIVPDLWQQQAITALKEGKDVVVQAPTGAGKTFIFENKSSSDRIEKSSAEITST